MARELKYESIHEEFWEDEVFEDASFTTMGYFGFTFTNLRCTISGIYRATPEQLSGDLRGKLTPDQIRECEAFLIDKGRLVRDGGWLWVVNKWKRLPSGRDGKPKLRSAGLALASCTSRIIFEGWQKKYAGWMPRIYEAMGVKEIPFAGTSDITEGDAMQLKLLNVTPDDPPSAQPALLYEDAVQAVWAFYIDTMSRALRRQVAYTLTAGTRAKIITRLGDKVVDAQTGEIRAVTIDDLMTAIVACSQSDHHMARNPKSNADNILYNSLGDHILGSTEKLQKWLDKARGAPPATPVRDVPPGPSPHGPRNGFARPPADDPRSKRPAASRKVSLRDPEDEDPNAEVTLQ